MNDTLLEQLLHEGESSSLDYKRDQYPFSGASDDDKSELLKDILAFANAWRHSEAFILIGVEEVVGGRALVVGVSQHIPDNDLQQFVNSKTNRPVAFAYRAYPFEGKQVGVIAIPQQDRPIYLIKGFGKLERHVVYYRQGTSTAVASPDLIARMGTPLEIKKLLDARQEDAKREEVRVKLGGGIPEGFYADIYNSSEIPIYIKEVALCRSERSDALLKVPLKSATPSGANSEAKGSESYDLPARKEVRFVLPRCPVPFIAPIATCAPEQVWLSVSNYVGELHRVNGEEVQHLLADVVELWKALDEAAKPREMKVVFYSGADGSVKEEAGSLNAVLVKPGGMGPVEVRMTTSPGLSFSESEAHQLADALVNNVVTGRIGKYEWRVE